MSGQGSASASAFASLAFWAAKDIMYRGIDCAILKRNLRNCVDYDVVLHDTCNNASYWCLPLQKKKTPFYIICIPCYPTIISSVYPTKPSIYMGFLLIWLPKGSKGYIQWERGNQWKWHYQLNVPNGITIYFHWFPIVYIWENCNTILHWKKAILTFTNHDSSEVTTWGHYNLPRLITIPSIILIIMNNHYESPLMWVKQ